MFDDDQETPNTLNCAFEFNENGKQKMMEFEVRHWMTNGEASIGTSRLGPPVPDPEDAPQRPAGAARQAGAEGGPGGRGGRGGPGGPSSDRIGDLFYGSKGYLAVDSYSSYKSWIGKAGKPGRPITRVAITS